MAYLGVAARLEIDERVNWKRFLVNLKYSYKNFILRDNIEFLSKLLLLEIKEN